jgi:hypothetical protein
VTDPADWRADLRRLCAAQSVEATRALRDGLASGDPCLLRAVTFEPPNLPLEERPICGACLVVYGPWRAGLLATVAQAERWFFDRTRVTADHRHGQLNALIAYWDGGGDREFVAAELVAELGVILGTTHGPV